MDSFHTAASQVRPVPDEPRFDDMVAATATGHDLVPMLDTMMQRHAIQQANVDAYAQYVAASQYNTANVPVLNVIGTGGAPISVTPALQMTAAPQMAAAPRVAAAGTSAPLTRGAGVSGAAVEQRRTVGARHSTGSPERLPASGGSAASGRSTATPPAPSTSDVTTPSDAATPPQTSSGPDLDPRPMGNSGPAPVGGWSEVGAGWNANSAHDRVRLWGEGDSGIRVPRSDLGQSPGRGERSGAVVRSVEEEVPTVGRDVAARSGPTGVAGPVSGARRDKDGEHKRRYGVDEDGETRFGMDGLCAPPVIGETAAERDLRDAEELARHHRDS
jgi:hypothetical protein